MLIQNHPINLIYKLSNWLQDVLIQLILSILCKFLVHHHFQINSTIFLCIVNLKIFHFINFDFQNNYLISLINHFVFLNPTFPFLFHLLDFIFPLIKYRFHSKMNQCSKSIFFQHLLINIFNFFIILYCLWFQNFL